VACAAERPHLVKHALDAFSRDESQRKYGHLPAGLVLKWDSYAESQRGQRQGRLASAQSYFEHRCLYLESQGNTAPDCAAWLPPDELDKFKAEYPSIDLALVRRSAAPIAKAKPEQRSNGTLGSVADDPELAKYVANPES